MIRSAILVLVLCCRLVSSGVVLSTFRQEALDEHNAKRTLHCVPSLMLNATLNDIAQNYSEYLAANRLFAHSGASGLGENLWMMSSSVAITSVTGNSPTNSWYSEISAYNYNAPGFSLATGHFTQVVWRATTQVGIGIAFTNDSKGAYVVANYYIAGNLIGAFPANVPALCAAASRFQCFTVTHAVAVVVLHCLISTMLG